MALLGFAIVVLLALAVYAVSTRRPASEEPSVTALPSPPALWATAISPDATLPSERIALVRRLQLIADARSTEVLERALAEESDDEVRSAIWRALLELRTHE